MEAGRKQYQSGAGLPAAFSELTCLKDAPADDHLVAQIREDLAGGGTVLDLLNGYLEQLRGEKDNDALPYRKLQRLFELGAAPERLDGHHYGVTIGLRTGNLTGVAAEYGNLVGYVWGTLVGGVAPWVGKSFTPMEGEERQRLVGDAVPESTPVCRGINHFNQVEHAPVNVSLIALLNLMLSPTAR